MSEQDDNELINIKQLLDKKDEYLEKVVISNSKNSYEKYSNNKLLNEYDNTAGITGEIGFIESNSNQNSNNNNSNMFGNNHKSKSNPTDNFVPGNSNNENLYNNINSQNKFHNKDSEYEFASTNYSGAPLSFKNLNHLDIKNLPKPKPSDSKKELSNDQNEQNIMGKSKFHPSNNINTNNIKKGSSEDTNKRYEYTEMPRKVEKTKHSKQNSKNINSNQKFNNVNNNSNNISNFNKNNKNFNYQESPKNSADDNNLNFTDINPNDENNNLFNAINFGNNEKSNENEFNHRNFIKSKSLVNNNKSSSIKRNSTGILNQDNDLDEYFRKFSHLYDENNNNQSNNNINKLNISSNNFTSSKFNSNSENIEISSNNNLQNNSAIKYRDRDKSHTLYNNKTPVFNNNNISNLLKSNFNLSDKSDLVDEKIVNNNDNSFLNTTDNALINPTVQNIHNNMTDLKSKLTNFNQVYENINTRLDEDTKNKNDKLYEEINELKKRLKEEQISKEKLKNIHQNDLQIKEENFIREKNMIQNQLMDENRQNLINIEGNYKERIEFLENVSFNSSLIDFLL